MTTHPSLIRSKVGITLAAGMAVAVLTLQAGETARAEPAPAPSRIPSASVTAKPDSFADMVEAVKPAVVNISTSGDGAFDQGNHGPRFRLPHDSPFQDFFDRFFERPGRDFGGRGKIHAVGSGFIVDPAGYVVTNHHVIKGASDIAVVTTDGARYPATLRGFDAKTDLALLKVDAEEPLPYVEFGDSDDVRVGDWVVAIGNPFGLGGTATTGIVSARGRDLQAGPFDDYLQIDAPINRGNSGGPLFTIDGKVVGVNTAIFSPNGGNVGIGFAIPSGLAEPVVAQLKERGEVARGFLGVHVQAVTGDISESLGLEDERGALVAKVVAASPAEKAGIAVGDVILSFDGEPVTRMRDLPKMVANVTAPRDVVVEVWRAGSSLRLSARIDASGAPSDVALSEGRNGDSPELGLILSPLTPDQRRFYRIPEETHGVLVTAVEPGSSAADKGLSAGDVIKMVGGQKVDSPSQVKKAVTRAVRANRASVLMLVARRGDDRFVALKLS